MVCNQSEGKNIQNLRFDDIPFARHTDYIRLAAITYQTFGLNKQPKLRVQLRLFVVEMVGVEPTSYSAAKKLSTYLVYL